MLKLAFAWFAAAAFAASLGYFLYAYLCLFDSTSGAPYGLAVNVMLFTVFAVHHSLFARTGIKQWVRARVPVRLERAVYTLVASLLFLAVCWFWRPVDGTAWRLPAGWRWAGYGAQLAGFVLTLVGARALDVWELAGVRQVDPTFALGASAGGPQPRQSVTLKTDGLYGFVRHPLYFAWVLLVFGAPDMTMTRLSFAVISSLYLAVAIPFEERSLIETFGRDYASYRKKVRWRMLPGIY